MKTLQNRHDGLISIVIPSHNDSHFLCNLLTSIFGVGLQHFEVIVVDNGSTDSTNRLVESWGVIYKRLDNKVFPSVARNYGVSFAKGNIIALLDSDVIITTQWAKRIMEVRDDYVAGKEIFTGDYYHVSRNPSWVENAWFKSLYFKKHSYLCGGNIIIDRPTYFKINGFDESLETGEDVDFCFRFLATGGKITFDESFYVYHEGYPKNLKGFFYRERWHGKSDFISFKKLVSSKVAVATILFLALHMILAISIFISSTLMFIVSFLIIFLVLLNSYQKNKNIFTSAFWISVPISYVYFCGRGASIFNRN